MTKEKQEIEIVEDVQVDEVKDADDTKEDDRVSTEDKDSPDSIIARIGQKLRLGKKAGPEDVIEDSEEDKSEEISEDIPDDFTAAAREVGWSDKEIEDFAADYKDEDLLEMLPQLSTRLEEADSKEQTVESEQEDKSPAPDKESDKFEQFKAELEKKYDEKFSNVEKGLREAEEKRGAQTLIEVERKANEIFDEANKDFEIFGKTEDLPKFPNGEFIKSSPAFKARSDVYDVAMMFLHSGKSQNMTDAMKDALSYYKGKTLEKDVERKLIKSLKKGEKNLSARRTAKDVAKTYDHPDDEKADVVKGIAQKVGVDLET